MATRNRAKPDGGPVTQILVAAVIALLVGSSAPWWWDKLFSGAGSQDTSTSPASQVRSPRGQECLEKYFVDTQPDRVIALEEGVQDAVLIRRDQEKDEAIGVKFTENSAPIGALQFRFFSAGSIFKILSAVDASCNTVEEYAVEGRPGEKRTLQNWDTLNIQFGGQGYAFSPDFSQGVISADFVRTTP